MTEGARAKCDYPVRWTVEEYFGLVHQGVLRPDDRVELLEGLIVAMSPQNPRHAEAVWRTHRALERAIGDRGVVRVQTPLVLDRSAPEPDVAVVPARIGGYADSHPRTALLVVEVADSSLIQDRLTKASIYAHAGIPEYWIVNLVNDRLEVFREVLQKKHRYANVTALGRGDRIVPVTFPDASIAVDDLLPPPPSS